MSNFGRLTQIELREHWEDEAGDFTPWLAEEENITLLSDSIRMNLEVEAQERNVGAFKADLLCRDTNADSWVLIENQLEPTDHKHLGQLLTYAAGLDAVTVIWIAKNFTDEHRAALDWLNRITAEEFGFFGLEIELWQIGDSVVAPKFNVVSHPNDWQKTIDQIVHKRLTPANELYLEYWTALRDYIESQNSTISSRKPQAQCLMGFAIGRSDFSLHTWASVRGKWVRVDLMTKGEDGKAHFNLLKADRIAIEEEIGSQLDWEENPKENYICLYLRDTDLEDRQDWSQQHQWLCEHLEIFHKVFAPRVEVLDASNYQSETEDIL